MSAHKPTPDDDCVHEWHFVDHADAFVCSRCGEVDPG